MASSSTGRTKTSDNKSNETSETVHESNKIKTTTSFEHVTEKPAEQSYHLKVLPPRDQSNKQSPHVRQKTAFCPFGTPSIQSNFFSHSTKELFKGSSTQRLNARPFDEFAILQPNSDAQGGTSIKTDGSSSPWTDKKT